MTKLRMLLSRVLGLFGKRRREGELSDEIQAHLDLLAEDHIRHGLSAADASAAARRQFGGVDQVKESYRDQRGLPFMDVLVQDVRYALRTFRRSATFTVATVLTLGLGIGATTAMFSVVDAVLLRPLPYPGIDRLLSLSSSLTLSNSSQTGEVYHYVKDRVRAFSRLAAYDDREGWNLVVGSRAEYVNARTISSGYFEVLGVAPQLGREFTEAEDSANGPAATIISDAIWRKYFEGRPDAIGQVVQLGGSRYTVVGVMPATLPAFPPIDIWTPLRLSPRDGTRNTIVVGRLRDGVSTAQATAELDAILPSMKRDVPAMERNFPGRLDQIAWRPFQDVLTGEYRFPLLLLLGAVGFVLLIACANVAGLQLVRATARRCEMATRAALGGGAGRAVRQVFTESLLLGVFGAAAGLVVAQICVWTVVPQLSVVLAITQSVAIDRRILAMTMGLAVSTSVIFGLWPALDVARIDLRTALWDGGSRSTGSGKALWLRRAFVLVEISLAAVLLVGAGLFIRALTNLTRADLGFSPERVVTAQMSLQGNSTQTDATVSDFYERTLDRIRDLPGVEAAAVGNNVPVERGLNMPIEPAGSQTERRSIEWRYITPDYLTVFRVPLTAGRVLESNDTVSGPPVALVNEAFARAYFGRGPAAIGQSIQLARALRDAPRQIVGVVGDVKSASGAGWTMGHPLAVPATPTVFVPVAQVPANLLSMVHSSFPVTWAIRTRGVDAGVLPELQRVMSEAMPTLPVIRFTTMEEIVDRSTELDRLLRLLLAVFAGLALLLAAIGIYGLVAYSVAQRTHEIGVRMALGATERGVLNLFLKESARLAVAGVVIGTAAAAGLSRFVMFKFFGVEPLDAVTFGVVAGTLMVVACVAGFIPALRAARVEPTVALRYE